MLHKTLDFGVDGKIVMTINDMGQQKAHEGDNVVVEASATSVDLINFGSRVKFPLKSGPTAWGIFFEYNGKRNFIAATYPEAIALASEWLDEVARIASNAVMARRAAYFSAGTPPAKD